MGNLTQESHSIVLQLNMCYLHFWARVCNQYEVKIYYSQRFLEIASKTLVHPTTVPTLQDAIRISVDSFDPRFMYSSLSSHLQL